MKKINYRTFTRKGLEQTIEDFCKELEAACSKQPRQRLIIYGNVGVARKYYEEHGLYMLSALVESGDLILTPAGKQYYDTVRRLHEVQHAGWRKKLLGTTVHLTRVLPFVPEKTYFTVGGKTYHVSREDWAKHRLHSTTDNMKVLIDNYGKTPQEAWPRAMTCHHCKSVLRVEAEDIRTDGKGESWRSILYQYFDCPLCKGFTLVGHNAFKELKPIRETTEF